MIKVVTYEPFTMKGKPSTRPWRLVDAVTGAEKKFKTKDAAEAARDAR